MIQKHIYLRGTFIAKPRVIKFSERPKQNFTETEPKPKHRYFTKLKPETQYQNYIVLNTWWPSQITTNSIVLFVIG